MARRWTRRMRRMVRLPSVGLNSRVKPRLRRFCGRAGQSSGHFTKHFPKRRIQMSIKATAVTALFQVFDMRKSVAFYCDVLGFELVHKHEPEGHLHWAMLKLDGAVVMLNSKY